MIKKAFIDYIAEKSKVEQRDLIEKDFLLQSLIMELAGDKSFNKGYIFKGGTCLIKCYLGYYRFSEDLDFTWRKQNLWNGKSRKQIRALLSSETGKILGLLADICSKLELDFKPDKKDSRYIEFGSGNKFITFKLWYNSSLDAQEQFIKIQISFIEKMIYKTKRRLVKTLASEAAPKEMEFLFPEYKGALFSDIKLFTYDVREILIEKVRAIITRRGIKARDFFDVYFITRFLKTDIRHFEKPIIEKILFMLSYEKYLKNLLSKEKLFTHLKLEGSENILLKSLDKQFYPFIKNFYLFLDDIVEKIKNKIDKKWK